MIATSKNMEHLSGRKIKITIGKKRELMRMVTSAQGQGKSIKAD